MGNEIDPLLNDCVARFSSSFSSASFDDGSRCGSPNPSRDPLQLAEYPVACIAIPDAKLTKNPLGEGSLVNPASTQENAPSVSSRFSQRFSNFLQAMHKTRVFLVVKSRLKNIGAIWSNLKNSLILYSGHSFGFGLGLTVLPINTIVSFRSK
jgi:hypothetical protein